MTEEEREGLLSIDLEAIAANYGWLRHRLTAGARCGAVVKADAYGLGASEVAPVLYRAGCRDFFVSLQSEGEQLAAMLPADARIILLTGVRPGCEKRCAEQRLVPVLVTTAQVRRWIEQTAGDAGSDGVAAPCALKVDSGMTRLGMGAAEFSSLLKQPDMLRAANLQLILSHLACADEPAHPQNFRQLESFRQSVTSLRQICPDVEASLANSSGICLGGDYHFDVVRPGCALYGVNPCPGHPSPMRTVVNLYLPLLQLREVESDCAVGYGATESAPAGSWLAVVRGGYADGILRTQSGHGWGQAVIGSERVTVPMRGRVSMDTTVFDVSALSDKQRSQLSGIEILNSALTVDEMGDAAGTIGYEILTSLGHRYCRRYL